MVVSEPQLRVALATLFAALIRCVSVNTRLVAKMPIVKVERAQQREQDGLI